MDKKILVKFSNVCKEVFEENFVAIHYIEDVDNDLGNYLLVVFTNRRPITIYLSNTELSIRDFLNDIIYYL